MYSLCSSWGGGGVGGVSNEPSSNVAIFVCWFFLFFLVILHGLVVFATTMWIFCFFPLYVSLLLQLAIRVFPLLNRWNLCYFLLIYSLIHYEIIVLLHCPFHQHSWWVWLYNIRYFFRSVLAYVLIFCSMVYFNIWN